MNKDPKAHIFYFKPYFRLCILVLEELGYKEVKDRLLLTPGTYILYKLKNQAIVPLDIILLMERDGFEGEAPGIFGDDDGEEATELELESILLSRHKN
jgi:hypothetical protein